MALESVHSPSLYHQHYMTQKLRQRASGENETTGAVAKSPFGGNR